MINVDQSQYIFIGASLVGAVIGYKCPIFQHKVERRVVSTGELVSKDVKFCWLTPRFSVMSYNASYKSTTDEVAHETNKTNTYKLFSSFAFAVMAYVAASKWLKF